VTSPILIVDDDAEARHLIGAVLALHGLCEYDEARDGVEALHKISSNNYSLIVLDLIMPLASGMDLLWSLRALDAGLTGRQSAIPHVIVLTALAEQDLPEDHVRAVARSQVKAVLRKPIDVKELSGLIRSHRQAHADR
jgi:CheY-like chemotaxis protein